MENLFERLRSETVKAIEKSKLPKRKPKPLTAQQKAKKFLKELPKRLLEVAKEKPRLQFHEVNILALGHNCWHYNHLDEFQKMVFDGCRALGLPVEIKETFTLPPGERESEGYSIYLRW
jgi:hypothetical protein